MNRKFVKFISMSLVGIMLSSVGGVSLADNQSLDVSNINLVDDNSFDENSEKLDELFKNFDFNPNSVVPSKYDEIFEKYNDYIGMDSSGNFYLKDLAYSDLSKEEIDDISFALNEGNKVFKKTSIRSGRSVAGIAGIIGIIVGVITIYGATYKAGRYAASSLHNRGILTKAQYRRSRWYYRSALAPVNWIVLLGIDDYYMGY